LKSYSRSQLSVAIAYRAVANLRNIFRKIMAGAVFTDRSPPRIRREKTSPCRKKNFVPSVCRKTRGPS
jgi:hypothetical protein